MSHTKMPIDCVVALTYNCNAKCTMCDIWKIKNSPELTLEDLAKLPDSLLDVNISGGETFLRKDLPEIVAVIKKACPKARLVISSNGFLPPVIDKAMDKILKIAPDIGVAISIDGMGKMHDEMRGTPGGFDRCMESIKILQKKGMTNLRLAFTITEYNIDHFAQVYDLTRQLGIQFTHSFAQSSEFYFGGKQNINNPPRELLVKGYTHIIRNELKSWNLKRWLRAFFASGMFRFITSKNPVLDNAPGRDFFFLDPSGDIYPSVVHNFILGNIRKVDNFKEFWLSPTTDERRKKVDALRVPVWMVCTARTALYNHPFAVGWWILRNKFFGFNIQ
ncbi:MAG: radical SAM protein [Candidatus Magasanikbacteria bacterium]|nr:radical SAM protein [Candidatus Magasanikbacteria bacterium]